MEQQPTEPQWQGSRRFESWQQIYVREWFDLPNETFIDGSHRLMRNMFVGQPPQFGDDGITDFAILGKFHNDRDQTYEYYFIDYATPERVMEIRVGTDDQERHPTWEGYERVWSWEDMFGSEAAGFLTFVTHDIAEADWPLAVQALHGFFWSRDDQ